LTLIVSIQKIKGILPHT